MPPRKTKVIKLDKIRSAKREADRQARFARVEADLELLEINEFNFVSPTDDTLDIFPAGKAWLHQLTAKFGLDRLPENEAELLGTQQALMLLIMMARPTPWADQDADWLAAGRHTLADSLTWGIRWFEAYLVEDVEAMREAMIEDDFIAEAANEWRITMAAREEKAAAAGETVAIH